MMISFREKLRYKELRNLRLLNLASAVFVTLLGFIFEFAYHDGNILFSGLIVSLVLTSNYFFSFYSDFFRKHFISISHGSILLLHLWAAYVAYERDFEIEILLPVAISTFTFSLLYDKFYKSLTFIFIISTFLLFLMVIKDEWKPQYTITLIALFSGAFVSEEIMKRKTEYQEEINDQERKYLSLVENMNDGLLLLQSGTVLLVNDRFCSITGFTKEEIEGKSLKEFAAMFHSDDLIRSAIAGISDKKEASILSETTLKRKDGNTVSVRLRAASTDHSLSGDEKFILVYTDISDLKRTQDQLKKREEGYRTFIDQSAVGIWRAEFDQPISIELPADEQIDLLLKSGVITECNDVMAKMYGYRTTADLVGKRIGEFFLNENHFDVPLIRKMVAEFISNHYRLSNTESKAKHGDGSSRYILNNNIGIVENSKLVRIWGVQTDITDRKRTERELMETNQELDTFFYKASHDLKGPLASVMGIVNLARIENEGKEHQTPYFDLIEKSVKRLDRTLMDLIELARTRKGSAKKSLISIKPLIEEIIKSLEHLMGFDRIEFRFDLDPDMEILADKVLLLSVFQNLIHNSINYSTSSKPYIMISGHRKGDHYEFVVADNGSGIPDRIKDKVFGMFYRGNPDSGGSGLGLFIVKNALDKMNGTIRLESVENEGTSFYLTIPVYQNEIA